MEILFFKIWISLALIGFLFDVRRWLKYHSFAKLARFIIEDVKRQVKGPILPRTGVCITDRTGGPLILMTNRKGGIKIHFPKSKLIGEISDAGENADFVRKHFEVKVNIKRIV